MKKKRIWHFFIIIICFISLIFSDFQEQVVGNSMYPLLEDGDWIFIKKPVFDIKKGDIIIFRTKGVKGKIIKKVVGIPGEKVEIKEGQLIISGTVVVDNVKCEDSTYVLKKNEFYVLGEKLETSIDSRSFGPVYRKRIIGKALFRYWPFRKLN